MRPARLLPAGRAAWWALRSAALVKRQSGAAALTLELAGPPVLGDDLRVVVLRAMRAARRTCLQQSVVLQRWDRAHGRDRDVVIGVAVAPTFRAHAWLEGTEAAAFTEIARRGTGPGPLWHRGRMASGDSSGTVRIPDRVAFEAVDGEAVLLDLDAGRYFRLTPVATRIWETLAANGGDVDGAVTALLDVYDVERAQLEADVRDLLAELAARELVELRD